MQQMEFTNIATDRTDNDKDIVDVNTNYSEDKVIILSKDIYSMIVLLIETDSFSKISFINKTLIMLIVLFSAFTQLSGVILLNLEGGSSYFNLTSDEISLRYIDGKQWSGMLIQTHYFSFTPSNFIIRLVAFGVLAAYLSQDVSSIVDYCTIITTAKRKIP
eukprot:263162_1